MMGNDQMATLWLGITIGLHIIARIGGYMFYLGPKLRAAQQRTWASEEESMRAWLPFKRKLAIMLNMDGITFAFIIAASIGTLHIPPQYAQYELPIKLVGAVLAVIGAGVKYGAYKAVGDKGYYCYNFFCKPGGQEYTLQGVYKYLKNPMYGVGYFHLFGFSLLFLSFWGLVFACFDWAMIWLFYFIFEKTHTDDNKSKVLA